MSTHKCDAFRQNLNTALCNAFRKYGWDTFIWDVLEECDDQIIDEREIAWISKLNTVRPGGYNLEFGGKTGKVISDEVRKQRSLVALRPSNVERMKQQAAAMRGSTITDLSIRNSKPVVVYDQNGRFVIVFDRQSAAADFTSCSINAVSRCVRGVRLAAMNKQGEIWQFSEGDKASARSPVTKVGNRYVIV